MAVVVTMPIAIALAMLSGVILGGPTLRLRGDYLAIVTLGFGEIIRIIAAEHDSFTNGDRGHPAASPHPPGTYADGTPIFGVSTRRRGTGSALTGHLVVFLVR